MDLGPHLIRGSLGAMSPHSKQHLAQFSETDRKERIRKGKSIYITPLYYAVSKCSGMDHTVLPANTPCLPFLRSVRQMAPSPTEVTDIQLQLITHLLTLEG